MSAPIPAREEETLEKPLLAVDLLDSVLEQVGLRGRRIRNYGLDGRLDSRRNPLCSGVHLGEHRSPAAHLRVGDEHGVRGTRRPKGLLGRRSAHRDERGVVLDHAHDAPVGRTLALHVDRPTHDFGAPEEPLRQRSRQYRGVRRWDTPIGGLERSTYHGPYTKQLEPPR
jgi:hypothetical protein